MEGMAGLVLGCVALFAS